MMRHWNMLALVAALLAILIAGPALAQGRGKAQKQDRDRDRVEDARERQRPELRRRGADRDDHRDREEREDREDARWDARGDREDWDDRDDWEDREDREEEEWSPRADRADRAGRGGPPFVPPGWCRGRGNPHNTPENCGYRGERRDPREDGGWDGRYDPDRRSRDGSWARAHEEFHYHHDRACRLRAAERPLDLAHQIRVRAECKAEHDRWHRRTGIGHEG